jgi:hypothetical protein
MAKQQSFADKAMKAAMQKGVKCPKCEGIRQSILNIETVLNPKTNSYKFLQKHVNVCKCNEKEIYG